MPQATDTPSSMSPSTSPPAHSNEEWLTALRPPVRAEMVEKLRRILMRGLRNILNGRIRDDVDAVVEDFTQEALIKILDSLDSFRGECRFTTWAQKIAVRTAMVEIRRKRWQDVSLEALLDEDDAPQGLAGMSDDGPNPEEQTTRSILMSNVERIIEEELTQRQKETIRAFTLHLTHGVPLDELARRFNTNRNAFYKLLHDSRKRLKKLLEAEGITLEDI